MDLSKHFQLSYRRKRKALPDVPDVPEDALQRQMDDMLAAMGVEYRRIPDSLWRWLKANCPPYIIAQLSEVWKSKPDTLMLFPLTDKYSLACEVEIKSRRGNPNPRQKKYAERMPVQISRSTDENEKIVQRAAVFADALIKYFNARLNNDTETN